MCERTRHLLLHLVGSLAFLSLPVIFSPDFSASFRFVHIPPFQRDFIGFALVLMFFYLNYYLFLPKLFFGGHQWLYAFALFDSYAVIAALPYVLIPAHPMHDGM